MLEPQIPSFYSTVRLSGGFCEGACHWLQAVVWALVGEMGLDSQV